MLLPADLGMSGFWLDSRVDSSSKMDPHRLLLAPRLQAKLWLRPTSLRMEAVEDIRQMAPVGNRHGGCHPFPSPGAGLHGDWIILSNAETGLCNKRRFRKEWSTERVKTATKRENIRIAVCYTHRGVRSSDRP